MPPLPFQGTAWSLSAEGLATVAARLGVFAAEVWTVLRVETSGCGFLPDRRPQILYERHIFHRLTAGRYDDGDISDPAPGGYGSPGPHQHQRLAAALLRDRSAALQSASWGIGQILGTNHRLAGFADVESMVAAMLDSEDSQLAARGNFLLSAGLQAALKAHDWTAFARGYNGPGYAANRYDVRLEAEYRSLAAGPLPDLAVRAAQMYLGYLGFAAGPVDGVAGSRTCAALARFRAQAGLPPGDAVDAAALEQLAEALRRPPVPLPQTA